MIFTYVQVHFIFQYSPILRLAQHGLKSRWTQREIEQQTKNVCPSFGVLILSGIISKFHDILANRSQVIIFILTLPL